MKAVVSIFFFVSISALGQNSAVLLAKDDPGSPVGYPTNWPVQVQPVGTATNLPPRYPPPWRLVTQAQVDRWKTDHAAEMEAYQAAQEAAAAQPIKDRSAVIQNAIADLRLIRDSSGSLTIVQLSNAARVFARVLLAILETLLL